MDVYFSQYILFKVKKICYIHKNGRKQIRDRIFAPLKIFKYKKLKFYIKHNFFEIQK